MTNYMSVCKIPHLFYRAVVVRKKNDAVEPLLWDTSIQGPQNLVPEKCSHTLSILYSCIEGTPLCRGKNTFSTESILMGFTSLQETPIKALKKRQITKIVDKFKCSQDTMATAFKTRTVSLKSMYCTCGNSTHSIAEIR